MKRKILLLVLVIFLILAIFLSGCCLVKILRADVVITDWEQDYSGEWSGQVKVCCKITNTGNVEISYYKIWLTAYCEDGSSYEDFNNGLFVDVGHSEFDTCWINIGKNKKVISVKVTDWELEHYNYPNQ